MSHALATVLHRGHKTASNVMAACLASSRESRWETSPCGGGAWLQHLSRPIRQLFFGVIRSNRSVASTPMKWRPARMTTSIAPRATAAAIMNMTTIW